MTKGKETSRNPFIVSITFLREAVEEVKKVHCPTRQETTRATLVVLAMIFIFAVFLGLTDLLVGRIMQGLLT